MKKTTEIKIKKNNGLLVDYNPEKFHTKVFFAIEGLKNVSASEIEMNAALSIQDGTTSREIQKALTKSCADKISIEEPEYEIAAARLLNQQLRKDVYGGWTPRSFFDMVTRNCDAGYYDGAYIFSNYTEEEIKEFGTHLKYDEYDDHFVYSGLKKTIDSYLINRYRVPQETPQEMFMLINMFAFAKYPAAERRKWVLEGYKILANFEASFPTPVMVALRSTFRKFISCNLIATGDSKETLANTAKVILQLVAAGAGLGIMPGDIRGLDADIDNGRLSHTGAFQIIKGYEKNTKSFVQPTRDGSSTNFYPFFHVEILDMMVWGNNKGTQDTRIQEMDHAIMFTPLFFRRYANNEDITLFFMNDVPDITSYLGNDAEFTKRYEEAERTVPTNRQTKISAAKVFEKFIDERFLQSREYCTFMENIQEQGPYIVPIKMSNLCLAGDSKVYIEDKGEVELKDVCVGDKVYCKNIETNEKSYQTVLNFAMTSPKAKTLRITDTESNRTIICTPDHQIYTKNRGYVLAKDLKEDDILDIHYDELSINL